MQKPEAVAALAALAHETRLDVFRALVRAGGGGRVPSRLAAALGIPAPTLSFHLKELKNARLVTAERQGRSLIYRADYAVMGDLLAYLTDNCCREGGR